MIDSPGLILEAGPSDRLQICGPHADRVRDFTCRWARYRNVGSVPRCRIKVVSAPRQHIGLGTGTQLALSVATALDAYFQFPTASAAELAASVNRGKRSAVGTYGFNTGGLIVEFGKRKHEPLAQLGHQIRLPDAWRFVLIVADDQRGLSGLKERAVFRRLPPVPRQVTDELTRELQERLLPAAEMGCVDQFGESVYQYGMMAGQCFAPCQGGPFANERLAQCVQLIRKMGVKGVGQSSWGPTLFALFPNFDEATSFVSQFCARATSDEMRFKIATVNNLGHSCTLEGTRRAIPTEVAPKSMGRLRLI